MPITHRLGDTSVWVLTEGDVEYEDGLASLERAVTHAASVDAEQAWDIVFDVRRSSEDRSSDELRGIALFVAGHVPPLSGRCVVIAGDDFHYGLSRMFQAHCDLLGLRSRVVRDVGAAECWLQTSED